MLVPAVALADTLLQCVAPAADTPAVVLVMVVWHTTVQLDSALPFSYVGVPLALALVPTVGPAVGGTTVTIIGGRFRELWLVKSDPF